LARIGLCRPELARTGPYFFAGSSTFAGARAQHSIVRNSTATATLALALGPGGELPTEFRLFARGWNETKIGRFLFDEQAAASVMSAYGAWGVDLMIDLEHQALEPGAPPEPTARDARGWCKLELREDGSLWAASVTWTPDGAARLSEKRQRYVSPAFGFQPDTRRVTNIINVAITAIPATHDTPALVAARATPPQSAAKLAARETGMNAKQMKDAVDIVEKGDAKAALELVKGLIVAAAGGEPEPDLGESTEPAEVAAGEPAEGEAAASAGPAAAPESPKKDESAMAAARVACALTGKADPGEAMAELSRRSAVAVDLETREAKLAADRATLEAGERRSLVAQLVKLGVEIPATAWGDDKGTVPCARLAAEPLGELRARVAKLAAAPRDTARVTQLAPDPGSAGDLSPRELAMCSVKGIDPAKYAATRAGIRARSNHATGA
jgi:phage I-like protein